MLVVVQFRPLTQLYSIKCPNNAIIECRLWDENTDNKSAVYSFNIVMNEDNEMLEELVVVGYGVQKR